MTIEQHSNEERETNIEAQAAPEIATELIIDIEVILVVLHHEAVTVASKPPVCNCNEHHHYDLEPLSPAFNVLARVVSAYFEPSAKSTQVAFSCLFSPQIFRLLKIKLYFL